MYPPKNQKKKPNPIPLPFIMSTTADTENNTDVNGDPIGFSTHVLPTMRRLEGFVEAQPVRRLVAIGPELAARSPRQLQRLGVSAVLSVNGRRPWLAGSAAVSRFKVVDLDDEFCAPLLEHLEEAVGFMRECVASGEGCLVTCTAGMSRSASVVIAYLMSEEGLPLRDAFKAVRAARPFIRPNAGFVAQLEAYERQLHREKAAPTTLPPPTVPPRLPSPPAAQPPSGCELCALAPRTTWFREDPRFLVIECDSCDLPMVVLRRHAMTVTESLAAEMEASLQEVADAELGPGTWWCDRRQRTIADHLHWHARPLPSFAKELLAKGFAKL